MKETRDVISKGDQISLKAEFTKTVWNAEELYGRLKHTYIPFWKIKRRVKKIQNSLKALPDCHLKFALKDFADLALPVERLWRISKKMEELHDSNPKKLNRYLKQVIKAEKELEQASPDVFGGAHVLREAFTADVFPEPKKLFNVLAEKMRVIRSCQKEWDIPARIWEPPPPNY